MYGFTPYFLAVEDSQSLMARNQGAILTVWIAGLYSISLAGKHGHLQVSRGSNLFYRASGSSDVARLIALALACTTPLILTGGVAFFLLFLSYLFWGKAIGAAVVAVGQFSLLFYLPFLACCFLSSGVGAKVSSGAGVAAGFSVFLTGTFFPPLLSIIAGVGPSWVEIVWSVVPHFYAMDWSPAAIYMWDPSDLTGFGSVFFYGFCWVLIFFSIGALLFRASAAQNE